MWTNTMRVLHKWLQVGGELISCFCCCCGGQQRRRKEGRRIRRGEKGEKFEARRIGRSKLLLGLAGFGVRQSLVISHKSQCLAQSSIITTVANCDNESLGSIEFQERDEALKKQ